jgi:hypothetical protein
VRPSAEIFIVWATSSGFLRFRIASCEKIISWIFSD